MVVTKQHKINIFINLIIIFYYFFIFLREERRRRRRGGGEKREEERESERVFLFVVGHWSFIGHCWVGVGIGVVVWWLIVVVEVVGA